MDASPVILIADDHKYMLKLLRASLELAGCQVLTANSGEEALAKIHTTRIDLLLIDFEMEGLTGIETVHQLKIDPQYSNLPMILMTGRGQKSIAAEAMRAGVAMVMRKPFSPMELTETVQRLSTPYIKASCGPYGG